MRIRQLKKRQNGWQKLQFWRQKKPNYPWQLWLASSVGGGFLLVMLYTIFVLPDVRGADQLSFAESTIIYARGALDPAENPNDHILYTIHGDENREYIPLQEISPWVVDATLAIEDDGFYRHFGFDIGGIVKASLNHFFGIGSTRGGSTITQQLVKNTFLNNDRSIIRKINELLLSIKLEFTYSKDEILELYLNKIPYGNNAFGIEAAAKTYFNKSARDLSVAESSILASIPVAPSRFNPFGSNRDLLMGFYEMETSFRTEEEARAAEFEADSGKEVRVYKKGRKDLVLQRMLELGMITQSQFQKAWSEAINLEFKTAKVDIKAPHFVFYVRERLEEKYGKEFLNQGGLRIYTTLDLPAQTAAEAIVAEKTAHYADTYGAENVALTAIENGSGAIRVYIGGKDFFDEKQDGQVDVLTSRRQPGSSFKPFVYAAGFDAGYAPGTVVFDAETDFGNNYKPQNFDESFSGPVSFRRALNASLNIPAIKMAVLASPVRVLALASVLGVKYDGDADTHGVAIGVGVAEVEPLSHINAFQAFAGDGSWYAPTAILEVRNADDKLLEKTDIERRKQDGLDPEIAGLVRHILTDQNTRPTTDGFNWNKLLQLDDFDNGAKTGTSNRVAKNPTFDEELPESDSNRRFITVPGDSWTVGFTSHLVTGVWVGNNRGAPMRSGATGLTVAAPVWKSMTEAAHRELGFLEDKNYPEVKTFKRYELNKLSGHLATEETPEHLRVVEVFASKSLPLKKDDSIEEVRINLVTGLPAEEDDEEALTELKPVLSLQSIKPSWPAWQGPAQQWLEQRPKFINSLGEDYETGWEPPSPETLLGLTRQERRESLRDRLLRLRGLESNQEPSGPAPQISITSPTDGGTISPGTVSIRTDVQSSSAITAVEFYFDDQLVDEVRRAPFIGTFTLPSSFQAGGEHTLRVVVVDQDYQVGQDEVSVVIGQDLRGPEISFVSPVGAQEIPLKALFDINVNVRDTANTKEVSFWLGDTLLGTKTQAPYYWQQTATGSMGTKYVRAVATDVRGNESEISVPVSFVREKFIRGDFANIDRVLSEKEALLVEITLSEPTAYSAARLKVSQTGREVYSVNLSTVSQTAQISLPRTITRGNALLELQVKSDRNTWETIDSKAVSF